MVDFKTPEEKSVALGLCPLPMDGTHATMLVGIRCTVTTHQVGLCPDHYEMVVHSIGHACFFCRVSDPLLFDNADIPTIELVTEPLEIRRD